jgi:hypothetical protein
VKPLSEARARKRAHQALLAANPLCVYCGSPADTIDHMPPSIMFWGKQRPRGLEFSCCKACNSGTRLSEMAVALLSRAAPDATVESHRSELKGLLASVSTNIPGLLQEMEVGKVGQKLAKRDMGIPDGAGVLRTNGPILTKHMRIFGAKFGFAMHFEANGQRVPDSGGVQSIWFSNAQAFRKEIPASLLEMLPGPPRTLKQGAKEVSDQFKYFWALTAERNHALFYGIFRQSFAVASISSTDRTLFLDKHVDKPVFGPGDLRAGQRAP